MSAARQWVGRIVSGMACIERRKRRSCSETYYVRWVDPESKSRMTQKMDSKENAKLLLSVLRAHGNNVDAALKSAKDYLGGVYTVSRMVEDHIDLLPLTRW
jgi:hypothetical protein